MGFQDDRLPPALHIRLDAWPLCKKTVESQSVYLQMLVTDISPIARADVLSGDGEVQDGLRRGLDMAMYDSDQPILETTASSIVPGRCIFDAVTYIIHSSCGTVPPFLLRPPDT